MARKKRSIEELEAENKYLRYGNLAVSVASIINNLIRWIGLSKSCISAMEEYSRLALEYQAAREAYSIDPSEENWNNLQEAIKRLKRQDEIIKLNRWQFKAEKRYT